MFFHLSISSINFTCFGKVTFLKSYLSIIVFLLILSENLPKTKEMPLLSRMLIGLTFFSLTGVFFTVLISGMYSIKDKKKYRISDIIKYMFCSTCTKQDEEDESNDNSNNSKWQLKQRALFQHAE